MTRLARLAGIAMLGAAALGTAACAPQRTGDTYNSYQMQQPQTVGYGTIVSMRQVQVAGSSSGVGTMAGVAAGGIAGSAIGGGWRGPALGAIAGAVIGGIAGTAIERGATQGTATEFIIQQDNGQTIAVVQTNEDQLQIGERVVLIGGRQLRIARSGPGGGYAAPPPGQPYAPPPPVSPQRELGPSKG